MNTLMGSMMGTPLLVSSLIRHAARHAADTEIVSRRAEGDLHRTTWAALELRARRLAQALERLGVAAGERVGTLAWNGYRHVEIYYGSAGSGRVCHTINPRLHPEQIAWIVHHAQDAVLCFDRSFLPLVESLWPQLGCVRHFVLLADAADMPEASTVPGLLCYETLVQAEDGGYEWPELDEDAACGICYTSGTTGDPKGVAYSHRATVLHAMASACPDALGLSSRDSVLPVVPMFHVNAWGLPYSAAMVGAKLVLPGGQLDGASLYELFEREQVTFTAGVPTVWLGVLEHVRRHGLRFSSLQRAMIGGSACPPSMMEAFESYGVEVLHGWGMTEMSPIGTVSRLKAKHLHLPAAERHRLLHKQGRALFGVEMEVVDDDGRPLPWDGASAGALVVRGPWIIERYYRHERSALMELPGRGAWFPTGDIATIDADGFMQITDRIKDLIKSGGEWIGSIDLENVAMAHPAVQEAAVIAARHEKWGERPLLIAVRKPDAALTREELLAFFEGRVAKWQVPDDVVFVEALPHAATGKVQKLKLREQFKDHLLHSHPAH
ncbi:MAG: 3-(methylthio)propionyl-CoA ligase [Pseudomonadota bacterium]|uniref:3-(methylthio)propionyl-CoA ligase n=1 Tax=Caldimonas aquatica TaxID=376175 RepID=UPI0024745B37|nr:3-(methylthio)propionyl-CoA ligase [Schlegelella aquatica]